MAGPRGVPQWQQLADELRERMRSGELAPGMRVPSEPRLAQEYGYTRVTVRRAIAELRAEGLIDVAQGHGTRVRRQPARQRLVLPAGTEFEVRMPTPTERDEKGIPEGVPVVIAWSTDDPLLPELHAGDLYRFVCPNGE